MNVLIFWDVIRYFKNFNKWFSTFVINRISVNFEKMRNRIIASQRFISDQRWPISSFSRTRRQLRIIAVQKWPQLEKKVKYDVYDLFSSLHCPPPHHWNELTYYKTPYVYFTYFPGSSIKEFIFVRKEI